MAQRKDCETVPDPAWVPFVIPAKAGIAMSAGPDEHPVSAGLTTFYWGG